MFFEDCEKNVEAVKYLYRDLAKQHHPDLGGNTETMQRINAEYEALLRSLDGSTSTGTDKKEHTYHYNHSAERAVMEKLHEILSLGIDGANVFLIGSWIWVKGDTKPYRKELKRIGLRWISRRQAWAFSAKKWTRRASSGSLDDLAAKYGAEEVVSDPTPRLNR